MFAWDLSSSEACKGEIINYYIEPSQTTPIGQRYSTGQYSTSEGSTSEGSTSEHQLTTVSDLQGHCNTVQHYFLETGSNVEHVSHWG